jgi:chromate transporter
VALPFIHEGAVLQYHWVTERQFLDALAVGLLTPGPILMAVGFMGFLTAGVVGDLAATAGLFFPAYSLILLVAPLFVRQTKNAPLIAFLDGVTSAATGAVVGLVYILGRQAITDRFSLAVALVSFALLFIRKFPRALLVLLAAVLGALFLRS